MKNSTLGNALGLASRILLAIIFVMAGFGKLADPSGTAGYMSSVGVPGVLVWPTILVELGGGILIAIGYQTRIVALILAAFTLLTGLIFHHNFADQNQMIHFMKNLAIAGGFLALVVNGAGGWSIDANGDGKIDRREEIVFTAWDPSAKTDFDALRSVFDNIAFASEVGTGSRDANASNLKSGFADNANQHKTAQLMAA